MTTESAPSIVAAIGETAGVVWRTLADHGAMSLPQLLKAINEPRDNVMQAIGWLAREDKIQIDVKGRGRTLSLRR